MRRLLFILFLFALWVESTQALNVTHFVPNVIDDRQGSLQFEFPAGEQPPVMIELFYRTEALENFTQVDVTTMLNESLLSVPLRELMSHSGFLEYRLTVHWAEGETVTYPVDAPPWRITAHAPAEAYQPDQPLSLLSPVTFTDNEQVVIAISLDTALNPDYLILQVDGRDVTAHCSVDEFMMIYVPAGKLPAQGAVQVSYAAPDQPLQTWNLANIVQKPAEPPARHQLNMTTFEVVHFEKAYHGGSSKPQWDDYHRFGGNLSYRYGYHEIRASANISVKDFQENQLQPQSRFQITWNWHGLQVSAGDVHPALHPLVLSGKRLRGLHLGYTGRFFALHLAQGLLRHHTDVVDSTGSFNRSALVLSTRFGSRDKTSFGLTILKAKDQDDPAVSEYYNVPEENLAVGADFQLKLFRNRLQWSNDAAISLSNRNIREPVFSDEDAEDIGWPSGLPSPEDLQDIFTINDYLTPLNFTTLSSLAWQSRLQLNLASHNFSVRYRYIGPSYESFGNTSVMNDLKGLEISEGFQAMKSRLQVYLTGRLLADNLQGDLDESSGTTHRRSLQAAFSYYPVQSGPTSHVSILWNQRANDPDQSMLADTLDYRIDLADLNLGYRLNHRFSWLGRSHQVNAGLSWGNQNDRVEQETGTEESGLGYQSIQLQTGLLTNFNQRIRNRLSLQYYNYNPVNETQGSREIRTHDRVEYQYNRDLVLLLEPGLNLITPQTGAAYQQLILSAGAHWTFHEYYQLRFTAQSRSYLGNDEVEGTDFKFYLRLEQQLPF